MAQNVNATKLTSVVNTVSVINPNNAVINVKVVNVKPHAKVIRVHAMPITENVMLICARPAIRIIRKNAVRICKSFTKLVCPLRLDRVRYVMD